MGVAPLWWALAALLCGTAVTGSRVPRDLLASVGVEPEYKDPRQNDSCVCVPFYQCEDGQVVTDGSGLLDVRFGKRSDCDGFKICCNLPSDDIKKIETTAGTDKGIMTSITDTINNLIGTGDSGTGSSSRSPDPCVCVSYYLCDNGTIAPSQASLVDLRQVSSTGRCSFDNQVCCKVPESQIKPPPPCECVDYNRCDSTHVLSRKDNADVPACHSTQVCCTKPRAPSGGSGSYDPAKRPDYDHWKFCKSYPMSVGCPESRALNSLPTLRETYRHRPKVDATRLRDAIGYLTADDDVLIDILCHRTFSEREDIKEAYTELYGRNLYSDVTRTTRGHYENLMQALLTAGSYYQYLAKTLHASMDRFGTDEDVVFETLASSTSEEIDLIKPLFYNIEESTLIDDLKDDFVGDVEDVVVALANGTRDTSFHVDRAKARDQAQALNDAGKGRLGTEEETFKRLLTHENYAQLALILSEYEQLTGESFEEALEDEFSRHMEDITLAIVRVTRNLPAFFAERIHDALWGRGLLSKDDSSLIRIIVSRAELDLGTIAQEYRAAYGRELADDVELKTTGDYEDALLALLGRHDEHDHDDD